MTRLGLLGLVLLAVPARAQQPARLDTTWTLDGTEVRLQEAAYHAAAAFEARTDSASVEAGAAVSARQLVLVVRGARGRVHLRFDPRALDALRDRRRAP